MGVGAAFFRRLGYGSGGVAVRVGAAWRTDLGVDADSWSAELVRRVGLPWISQRFSCVGVGGVWV